MRHTLISQAIRCFAALIIISSVCSRSSNTRVKRTVTCNMMGCTFVSTWRPDSRDPNIRVLKEEDGKTYYLKLKPEDGDISGTSRKRYSQSISCISLLKRVDTQLDPGKPKSRLRQVGDYDDGVRIDHQGPANDGRYKLAVQENNGGASRSPMFAEVIIPGNNQDVELEHVKEGMEWSLSEESVVHYYIHGSSYNNN